MESRVSINQLIVQLSQNFEISPLNLPEKSGIQLIRNRLTILIHSMMHQDMNRLLSIFYKIDLDEEKVKNVLANSESNQIAEHLTELVLEREFQKVVTRLRYRDQE